MNRPYDSRIWYSMAICYEKANKKSEAIKCYEHAEVNVGDDGKSSLKLAQLYKEIKFDDLCAVYYQRYVNKCDTTVNFKFIIAYKRTGTNRCIFISIKIL